MFAPINGWTKQGIIDHIQSNWNGVSVGRLGCRYRLQTGAKCAVGLFIPDNLYSSSMEGYSVSTISKEHSIAAAMPLPEEALRSMQAVHDVTAGQYRRCEVVEDDVKHAVLTWVNKNVKEAV